MNRYSRGEFLGIGAALATGFGIGDFELRGSDARLARARAGARIQEAGDVTPDLILVGGRVYTVDDDLPRAEAFAVKNSRFIAVGSSDDIRNLAGPGTEVIDAEGMTGRIWGPNQRVTVSEALRIATINGARASHEEHLKGSITPGKLAYFVILAEDPQETDPEAFQEIGIIRTVVGGRTMHLA